MFHYRTGRWWWRAAAVTSSEAPGAWTAMRTPGEDVSPCGAVSPRPPSSNDLYLAGFINKKLADNVRAGLSVSGSTNVKMVLCDPDAR
ncbi:MAG: hypothetical protein WB810_09720, partial [Candidatus Cybelea sp.]